MNYHLKILGDLLEKNQGQYALSEKGKLAYRILGDFPEGPPMEQAYKWKRLIAQIIVIANSISLIVSTILFLVGNIDWRFYSSQMLYSLVAFLAAFIIFKFPTARPKYDPNRARKLTGFFFVLGGAMFTSILLFFAVGFTLVTVLGRPLPSGPLGDAFLLFSFGGGAILGGVMGYLLFKRSKYSDPSFYSPF